MGQMDQASPPPSVEPSLIPVCIWLRKLAYVNPPYNSFDQFKIILTKLKATILINIEIF